MVSLMKSPLSCYLYFYLTFICSSPVVTEFPPPFTTTTPPTNLSPTIGHQPLYQCIYPSLPPPNCLLTSLLSLKYHSPSWLCRAINPLRCVCMCYCLCICIYTYIYIYITLHNNIETINQERVSGGGGGAKKAMNVRNNQSNARGNIGKYVIVMHDF